MIRLATPPGSTPGEGREPSPTIWTLPAGRSVYRLFRPSSFAPTATTWRFNGPRARFDHQRGNSQGTTELAQEDEAPIFAPADDNERGILYAAFTLSCCLVEVFDALDYVDPRGWQFSRLTLTRDLMLLDLRGKAAMRLGTVAAISKGSHPMAQAWSRYFYEKFETVNEIKVDGLLYNAAHNDERAIALYERAQDALELTREVPLDAKAMRVRLLRVAQSHNMALDLDYLQGK